MRVLKLLVACGACIAYLGWPALVSAAPVVAFVPSAPVSTPVGPGSERQAVFVDCASMKPVGSLDVSGRVGATSPDSGATFFVVDEPVEGVVPKTARVREYDVKARKVLSEHRLNHPLVIIGDTGEEPFVRVRSAVKTGDGVVWVLTASSAPTGSFLLTGIRWSDKKAVAEVETASLSVSQPNFFPLAQGCLLLFDPAENPASPRMFYIRPGQPAQPIESKGAADLGAYFGTSEDGGFLGLTKGDKSLVRADHFDATPPEPRFKEVPVAGGRAWYPTDPQSARQGAVRARLMDYGPGPAENPTALLGYGLGGRISHVRVVSLETGKVLDETVLAWPGDDLFPWSAGIEVIDYRKGTVTELDPHLKPTGRSWTK